MGYKKADVEHHSDRGPSHPAVNVKVHKFVQSCEVVDRFGCDEETAQKALGFAWDCASEVFWEDVQTEAKTIWGPRVKVYSEGRSGGWAVVDGLDPFGWWDAVALGKWRRFECWCKAEVKWVSSTEYTMDAIMANRWAEPGAEAYNYFDTKDGKTVCLADLHEVKANAVGAYLAAL